MCIFENKKVFEMLKIHVDYTTEEFFVKSEVSWFESQFISKHLLNSEIFLFTQFLSKKSMKCI